MKPCARAGCTAAATCAVGIAIYPHRSLLTFYRTTQWLTRMILGLELCDVHFEEVRAEGAFALMPRTHLEPIAALCARSSRVAVDVEASAIVPVRLDDPDYLVLLDQRGQAKA